MTDCSVLILFSTATAWNICISGKSQYNSIQRKDIWNIRFWISSTNSILLFVSSRLSLDMAVCAAFSNVKRRSWQSDISSRASLNLSTAVGIIALNNFAAFGQSVSPHDLCWLSLRRIPYLFATSTSVLTLLSRGSQRAYSMWQAAPWSYVLASNSRNLRDLQVYWTMSRESEECDHLLPSCRWRPWLLGQNDCYLNANRWYHTLNIRKTHAKGTIYSDDWGTNIIIIGRNLSIFWQRCVNLPLLATMEERKSSILFLSSSLTSLPSGDNVATSSVSQKDLSSSRMALACVETRERILAAVNYYTHLWRE